MVSEWDIYWITRLDEIRTAAMAVTMFSFVPLAFLSVAAFVDDLPIARRLIKVVAAVTALAGFVVVFTPSTKEMVAIKVIPAVVNSETTHRVTHETVEAALRLIEKVGKGDEK